MPGGWRCERGNTRNAAANRGAECQLRLGVRGEELPHDVCGGDVVAADAQAGPHVVAALDGVEGYGGAILAAGIVVDVDFGGFGVFGCQRAPSFLTQNLIVAATNVSARRGPT